jgi:hypothetical protein
MKILLYENNTSTSFPSASIWFPEALTEPDLGLPAKRLPLVAILFKSHDQNIGFGNVLILPKSRFGGMQRT